MARKMKPSGVDWIGDIPVNWKVKRIKDVSPFKTGKDYPKTVGLIPVVGSGRDPIAHIDVFLIKNPALIIGRKGTIDKPYVMNQPFWPVDTCMFNTFENPTIKFSYACYALLGHPWEQLSTKTALPSLTQSDVNRSEILVPAICEQIAIATYLDDRTTAIDSKIQLLQEKSTALSDLRKSVIHQAVTKGLDLNVKMKPSGVDWIGDVPAVWSLKRIKDMSPVTSGKMLTTQKSESNCVELPYYKTSNLTQDTEFQKMWYSMEEVNHLLIYQGDVLVAEGGAVGFPKYIEAAPAEATSFQNHVYRLRTASAHSKWLYYFLLATYTAQVYAAYSKAVTIANLNSYTLKNIAVVEPLREEQQSIATYLDERTSIIDDSIKTITEQITALKSLRQSLIHEAVTGKINVADFGYKTT